MTDRADQSANGDDPETDFWLAVPGFRESLLEAEADIAAGRTFGEEEIRARYELTPRDAGQVVRDGTVDADGPLVARMLKAFPWMLSLSPGDRASCAQDLVDAARASFSTDQSQLILAELTSWKETATALAAGLDRGEPEWLDDGDDDAVVERP
ncbi:hypothetical protein ACJH6H_28360 [Mycobacterium sp. SMC-21]|uniref:hypothetical protein n=1 Tax=Mycobacteriaceae TaxID=1762 RepID=UPI00092664E4|nr:hypothetical protein [Mycobacteroides abscessus]SIN15344.1 Conserved protein of uncharacterised function, putative antitoxin RelB2 [Mycobacteroides abscessus subsp. abscessus]SLE80424.1 Conserved protein of uncharacterised function, putative antitoxin RelB2 [Mycobacteroides abscessus subsp. abscessus]